MKAYHMSETLRSGDVLKPDYQNLINLCEPFVKALERGNDCFIGMVLQGKYTTAVLERYGLKEWSDYAKWSTEGAFEFIRKKEFPFTVSRLKSCYFYSDLKNVKKLFDYDWGDEPEEVKKEIHLFEVELDDAARRFDMNFFDKAYSAMINDQDEKSVFGYARSYFAGEKTEDPVWEILYDKPVKIEKDVTGLLRR